jgi:hypothetical protein
LFWQGGCACIPRTGYSFMAGRPSFSTSATEVKIQRRRQSTVGRGGSAVETLFQSVSGLGIVRAGYYLSEVNETQTGTPKAICGEIIGKIHPASL